MQTTITKKKTALEIKVISINTLYEYAEKIINYEYEHFKQFLGKDIFKVDGSIKQKYVHESLSFDGWLNDGTHFNVHSWLRYAYHSFDVHVKICINGGNYDDKSYFCEYDELMTVIFDTDDKSLLIEKNVDRTYLKKRYNVEELLQKGERVKELAKEYERLRDAIPYRFRDAMDIERLTR